MIILGIECTAHTFGIGIVDSSKKEVLFNEKVQFNNDVGMDPRKLTEFHQHNFDSVLKKAKIFLQSINKDFKDLDLISFSQGPGMGNSLKFASLVAKTLSLKYKIKIVGVNHIRAHLEVGKMVAGFKDPLFLNITGVNSQVIAKDEFGNYRVYGETEDIGLGNLFDSCARDFGLGFPGGPKIEEFAKKSNNYVEIPYTIKGMNISLAGTHSFVKQKLAKGVKVEDLCYSLQETIFAMLMEVAERAIAYTNKNEFLIVGGVAGNKRFMEMGASMAKHRNCKFVVLPLGLCMDNGAMIAWMGYVDRKRASYNIENLKPRPYITIETDL